MTITINCISVLMYLLSVDEERVMHSKSNNIQFISYDNANKVVNNVFRDLFQDTKLV